jgi:hypothetical protein
MEEVSRSAMFRLNDAVRRYQAQHQSQPESRRVAASVATLSPRARPETTRVVATVAAVATPPLEPTHLVLLLEQLREEGALLQHQENALLIRPTHWRQMDRLSPPGKPFCFFCKQTKTVKIIVLVGRREGRNFGYGRQLSYAGHKRSRICLPTATSPRSKRIAIAGKRLCAGVGQRTAPVTTMHVGSIDRRYTMTLVAY